MLKKEMNASSDDQKNYFGKTIMNKCRSRELSMYIKKATWVVNEISKAKEINSANRSLERNHSQSTEKRGTNIIEVGSSLIPSTKITLEKDENPFTRSFNKNINMNKYHGHPHSAGIFRPTPFKSMTQKNSFIDTKETMDDTPNILKYETNNRLSLQTSINKGANILSPFKDLQPHCRTNSEVIKKPIDPRRLANEGSVPKTSNLKLKQNLHVNTQR